MAPRRFIASLFLFVALVWGGVGLLHLSGSVSSVGAVEPPSLRSPVNYDFTVNNETVQVFTETDGSVTINYSITFTNYGTDFDYIDIGFPNDYYNLGSVTAYWSLEGAPFVELTDIDRSAYIAIGVEIFVP
ncbi:MAG: hypothetical protein ACFE9O_10985, partial [Promethearchaeota archaeon]